jgi:hypothetical protein
MKRILVAAAFVAAATGLVGSSQASPTAHQGADAQGRRRLWSRA